MWPALPWHLHSISIYSRFKWLCSGHSFLIGSSTDRQWHQVNASFFGVSIMPNMRGNKNRKTNSFSGNGTWIKHPLRGFTCVFKNVHTCSFWCKKHWCGNSQVLWMSGNFSNKLKMFVMLYHNKASVCLVVQSTIVSVLDYRDILQSHVVPSALKQLDGIDTSASVLWLICMIALSSALLNIDYI